MSGIPFVEEESPSKGSLAQSSRSIGNDRSYTGTGREAILSEGTNTHTDICSFPWVTLDPAKRLKF